MRLLHRRRGLKKLGFYGLIVGLCALAAEPALAADCSSATGLAPCFDANSLWLPAGRANFLTLPDTRVEDRRKMSFGFAAELMRGPIVLHVSSPDSAGRDVHVVDYALDASLFFTVSALTNLELSLALPTRLYQSGAGAGGVTSQSASPVEQSALRDPRLGAAYSLDDALAVRGIGLKLALDVSLPLGNTAAFAGERSVVAMPSGTLGWQQGPVALRASVGARLRGAADFGDVRLGNQAFFAFGAGLDVLDPGILFLSLEGFVLPPLASNRAPSSSASITDVRLVPAEWLFAAHTTFSRSSEWSLAASIGTGIPLSSETRAGTTSYFLAVTEPEWRSIVVVRFAPH